jgi:tetratricopeptide (TPR) repeat protein
MRSLALALSFLLLASPVFATCGGGGGGGVGGIQPRGGGFGIPRGNPQEDLQVYQVPWKPVAAGDPAPAGVLVLYWFPASKQEEHDSALQSSRQLTLAAARCVGLGTVAQDDAARREKYAVAAGSSLAVLVVAADGSELGRAAGKYGRPLTLDDAERLVRDGMKKQERAADDRLDAARAKAEHGDADGAAALYTQLWDERCLASGPAKKAAKELKKLGRPVPDEKSLLIPEPDQRPAMESAIARSLADGLRAENDLRIADAERLYQAAQRLDPADPVPLRFLGELYRHHTGDWERARAAFDRILAMPADPLSRAVALHGLGKITIHEGQSAQGLALFERSVASYPLALTYRNLAVYWSSEGAPDKAYGYVKQAMALEPGDEYNQIFAATFLVQLGKPEEAARVAREHESLLAASYNLAAIWAQLGERDRALGLLRRHFYTYERFDGVRRREMQEARVDIVFASLKRDPAFIALTALADGHGMAAAGTR